MFKSAIAFALVLISAGTVPHSAAHAQTIAIPGDLCGRSSIESAKPLEGKWLAVNRDGAGNVGPFGFALSSRPTENMALEYSAGGVLTFLGKNDLGRQRLDMLPMPVAEPLPDEFNVQLAGGRIVPVDVSELLPCDWPQMPGYKGFIDYPLQGMGEMRMTVMLNFPSSNVGFGLLHFTGNMRDHEIDVWRYVTVTRSGGKGFGGFVRSCNPLEPKCRQMLACQKDEQGRKREPEICKEE